MKLKYQPKEQYTTSVTILIPLDFDKTDKQKIDVTYKRLDAEQVKDLYKRVADAARGGSEEDMDATVAREYILGWDKLPAEEGGFIPFSSEMLDQVLKIPCYRRALVKKFMADLRDPEEAARKN